MSRSWAAADQLVHTIGRHHPDYRGGWAVYALCGKPLVNFALMDTFLHGNTNRAPTCLMCLGALQHAD